jgi:glycosyltransferase involved in cell wall biosynthesis
LPLDAFVCVFIAAGGARSSYKDWATVHRAIMRLRDGSKTDIVGVCIGGSNRPYESQGIRYTGYLTDQRHVAAYMQAADVLLYAARSDNSPCVIPEALACGLPVIATDVGGIGELIDDGRTGFLVPAGDAGALATRARQVLTSPSLLHRMRATAAETARTRFGLDRQASAYLEWFEALRHGVTS